MSTYRTIAPITNQRDIFPQPISALAFDPASDVLWSGNSSGSVVAYYGARGGRGVSFPVGGDLAVKKIIAGDQYVRALGTSGDGVGSWSKGGVNKWFYKSMHPITTFSNTISASPNIAAATSVPEFLLINNNTGASVRQWLTPSLVTHLVSSHTLLLSGSADGYLRTHDIRAGKANKSSDMSVKAHSHGVQGLEVSGNLVFTIGWVERQSRPLPDPIVKVFDIRSLKVMPPVSFSAGPGFINTLPRRSSSIVVTSSHGLVTILDASKASDVGEFYQLDISSYVSSVAVSPTGVYIAFGDAEGTVHLLTAAEDESTLPLNGFEGQPVEWAETQDPLPNIQWDDTTPLNTIGMPHYKTRLLSSWTSAFLPDKPYYPPSAKIPQQVLNSMKVNDFVGHASLPKDLQGKRNVVSTGPKRDQGRFRSGKSRSDVPEPDTPVTETSSGDIPRAYRKVEIEYSKFGVEDFDFGFFNKTELSGLESHIVNSYTNPMVQALHFCHPIRRLAKSHILINCNREHCLLCELGFVMRILEDARGTNCQASNFCKTVGALAQASNQIALIDFGRPSTTYSDMIQGFHRFLLDHLCSEGNAFPLNPQIVPSTSTAQPESRAMVAAPITQLLGVDTTKTIICSNCNATRAKEIMSHIVDLNYRTASTHPYDFAALLRDSLIQEGIHRASCRSCDALVQFESRRTIASKDLPPVLAINTLVYESNNHLHKFWLDGRQGSLLKPFVEIRGQVDGVDDPDVVTYELRSLIVEIVPKDKHGHLAAIVKVPGGEFLSDPASPWHVFNDFVVTNVPEKDALGFPGSWKVPAVLYYERVDMRDKLDYSDLPSKPDLSILYSDLSISPNRDNTSIKHELLQRDELPGPGTVVSIDAEFVSMQQEETEYKSDGTKKVLRPARLSLARVSVLRGDGAKGGVPFIDDHIHTSEIVVDYLTEFSGIKYGDLDPRLSRHTLVPLKVAYKKLRLLIDLGCIFIGHGLAKDFRIINVFVPPEQVLDTVDIYFIKSRQRRLSLRFLTYLVLKQSIQTGTHDSIEDARSALLLYKAFLEYESEGVWDLKLEELYREGKRLNWKPPPLPESAVPDPPVSPPPPPAMISPFTFMPNNMLQATFQGSPFRSPEQGSSFGGHRRFGQHDAGSSQQNWRRTHR